MCFSSFSADLARAFCALTTVIFFFLFYLSPCSRVPRTTTDDTVTDITVNIGVYIPFTFVREDHHFERRLARDKHWRARVRVRVSRRHGHAVHRVYGAIQIRYSTSKRRIFCSWSFYNNTIRAHFLFFWFFFLINEACDKRRIRLIRRTRRSNTSLRTAHYARVMPFFAQTMFSFSSLSDTRCNTRTFTNVSCNSFRFSSFWKRQREFSKSDDDGSV